MKYIDAEKLKSEIRIIRQSLENRDVYANQVKKIRTECMIEFCKCIFDVITSLQQEQPEDLEKEIDRWFGEKYMQNMVGLPIKPTVKIIAHYFAKWGAIHLNARKEE